MIKSYYLLSYTDKIDKAQGFLFIKALGMSEAMEIAKHAIGHTVELDHIDVQKDNIMYKGDVIFHYTTKLNEVQNECG